MRAKFNTAIQLKFLTDAYFLSVETHNKNIGYMRPSVNGLMDYLGMSKDEFLDYKNKPIFENVVNMAFLKIECDLEERTWGDEDIEGVMTDLVNDFGWEPLNDEDRNQIKLNVN